MGRKSRRASAPSARDAVDGDSEDVSDGDVAYVARHASYARFMNGGSFADAGAEARAGRGRDAGDGAETAYERERARRVVRAREEEAARVKALRAMDEDARPLALPVKRLDGTVVRDATAPADASASEGEGEGEGEGGWTDVGGGDGRGLGKKAIVREIRESDLGRETTKSKKNDKWWEKREEERGAEDAGAKKKKRKQKEGDSDDSEDDSHEDEKKENLAAKLAEKRRSEREALEAEMSAEARRESVRTRIAATCQSVIEDPESRWKELKEIGSLCEDRDSEIARMAALSLALVYRDICPGYRIRPPTEKEAQMKVSKEVMKTRSFEAGLLEHYKSYVKMLVRCSGGKKSRAQRGKGGPDTESAIKCLCALLVGLPSFNFRTDVLSAIVPVFGKRDVEHAKIVTKALGEAAESDVRGDLTLEALHMTAQLVKQTKCNIHACAFDYILKVRFDEGILVPLVRDKKDVLSRKQTFKKKQEERDKIRRARAEKARKEQDKERMKSFGHVADSSDDSGDDEAALNRDLDEGSAVMNFGEKKKMQSRLLEATFEMYFRVLKNASSPEPTPGLPMLSAALTGLAKFTHLISIDFLGDLMEVFRKLLSKEDLLSDTLKAQTLLTACEILSGHGEVLQVDTGEFYRQLYAMLGKPSAGATGWQEGMSITDQRALDHGTLRVRAIQRFIGGFKQVDQARMAAFAKRLASASIGMEAGECLGSLGVVRQILASYPRVRNLLENERIGNGVFQMDLDDPEHAQGLSAVLWDLCLLARHYHPTCAAAAKEVANLPLSGAIAPPPGSHAPSELARAYSTIRGDFNPPIPEPPPPRGKPRAPIEQKSFVDAFDASFERLVTGASSDAHMNVSGAALRRHFRRLRAHAANAELRAERANLARSLAKLEEHRAELEASRSKRKISKSSSSRKQ